MNEYLKATPLLDYENESIQNLIKNKCWEQEDCHGKILSVYNFVRDDILFGYNIDDDIPASKVLSDGYGQCNTKGTLFMALLRALKIPCRMHGFTIDKMLQKGAMAGFVYKNAPKEIVHSWVEVWADDKWINLEGFILDIKYLDSLRQKFADCEGAFCGYGVAVKDFKNPPVYYSGGDTYIQNEGIVSDFGVYNSPDEFFAEHRQNLSPIKQFAFRHYGRHAMNRNVKKLRNQ
ncbi:MAG: transglutaminase family protein [Ruminococcus sp.]|jgi:hypothetical protein|nr:transglutaminase family protein [Ruminococcus sp.]